MFYLVAVLLAIGTLAYLGYPLLVRDRSYAPDQMDAQRQLQELQSEKGIVLQTIKDLEFDLASGKLSPEDYTALRDRYELRALAVLQALDACEATLKAREAVAGAAKTPQPLSPGVSHGFWTRPVFATSVIGALVLLAAGGGFMLGRVQPDDRTTEMAQENSEGDGGSAVATLEARLSQDPRDVNALVGLGRLYLQAGQLPKAIEVYKRALEVDASNVSALSGMAMILAQAGHSDQALTLFDRALAINPQFPMALLFKGRLLYEEKKDYAGAIASWDRFLTLIPRGESADVVRGWIEEARRGADQSQEDSRTRQRP
jgi:cytochrome c-type biogenesis protein CcmH/NrfG